MYHVTTIANLQKILKTGIRPGKPQVWIQQRGSRFAPGYIYAFTSQLDAARWAFKQEWETQESTCVIEFTTHGLTWELDDHDPLSQASRSGDWIKTRATVPPAWFCSVMLKPAYTDIIKTNNRRETAQ